MIGLFTSERMELISSLPRAECVGLLQADLDTPWAVFGMRPVIGTVGETSLRARKRISYRNSYQTILFARFVEHNDQTGIHCRFGLRLSVRLFSLVWLAFVLLVGGLIFVFSLATLVARSPAAPAGFWLGLVVPPLLVACFAGLLKFCRYLARDERDFLQQYLQTLLRAQRV